MRGTCGLICALGCFWGWDYPTVRVNCLFAFKFLKIPTYTYHLFLLGPMCLFLLGPIVPLVMWMCGVSFDSSNIISLSTKKIKNLTIHIATSNVDWNHKPTNQYWGFWSYGILTWKEYHYYSNTKIYMKT
jgi:hypothetical protein